MPNWCSNHLIVTGKDADLGEFAMLAQGAGVGGGELSFNALVPEPAEIRTAVFDPVGYDWHVQTWGSPNDLDPERTTLEQEVNWLRYTFYCAWAPPSLAGQCRQALSAPRFHTVL